MLQWLNDLAYFLSSFFPHIKIIRSTHAGVRFRFGKPYLIEGGRIIVYWPIFTDILVLPVVKQTTEMAEQALTTFDGKSICTSMVVVYRIPNVFLAATKSWDIYGILDNISQSVLASLIGKSTFEEIQTDPDSFNHILRREINTAAKEYGIVIDKASLISFTKVIAIRNIQNAVSWGPGTKLNSNTGEQNGY
jgi:regulator of protease activity HflC (stomatin/prohibitin superfamily)